MSILRRLLPTHGRERRSHDPSAIPPPTLGRDAAGVLVNEDTAMRLGAVYDCVSLLADLVATLPLDAFRRTGPGSRTPVEPPPRLVEQPHPEMDRVDWLTQVVVSLLLRGNAYCLVVERDSLMRPTAVLPLHPDAVMPQRRTANGRILPASPLPWGYGSTQPGRLEYDVLGLGVIAREDMLHLRGLSFPGADVGLSPIEYHRLQIGLGIAATEFGASWFADGANPSGVLEVPANITKDQAKRLQVEWLEQHGAGRRRPAVVGGGMVWKPITVTPNESQFLDTRRYSRVEIAGMYRVPPHLIGEVSVSTSWGSGIEQQTTGLVTFTVSPWTVRIERPLSAMLPRHQYAKFNLNGLLRGDIAARGQWYMEGRRGGWFSVNDIRRLEDMPPIDGGDVYATPTPAAPAPQP